MRRFLPFMIFLFHFAAQGQQVIFSVGSSSALTIKSGTTFSADSLVLIPSANLTLSSNNMQVSHTAVNLSPNPSITRVYSIGSQFPFSGTIQLFYQTSELNGNPEASLEYTDSTIGGTWVPSTTSTVNLASHYVQQAAVARNFIGATATSPTTVLALSLTAFTGVWQGDDAILSWMIDQTGEIADFNVERSIDGTQWTILGQVAGLTGDGIKTYSYTDATAPAGAVLYRLQVERSSGQAFYSSIVKLARTSDETLRLVTLDHSVIAYFTGVQPQAVRIVNGAGATIRTDKTSRWRYEFDGLPTGVYYLQYERNGAPAVRGFLIL